MSEYEKPILNNIIAKGRTSEIYAYEPNKVLKLYHSDWPLELIEQEIKILKTINELGIPSPRAYETIKVGGRIGLVLEELKGNSLTTELKKHPLSILQNIGLAARLQADFNSNSSQELPLQRARLVKEITSAEIPENLRSRVLSLLNSLPDDNKVCHGDYHVDNLFATDKGLIVLDWATATRGNSLGDLARTILLIKIGAPPEHTSNIDRTILNTGRLILPLDKIYLKEYSKIASVLSDQLNSWVAVSAAARLSENYPEERGKLLAIISSTTKLE